MDQSKITKNNTKKINFTCYLRLLIKTIGLIHLE